MAELTKVQRLVYDIRSLKKIAARLDDMSANWVDVDYANRQDLELLHSDVLTLIEEFSAKVEEEKDYAKEGRQL
ncbi:hypothetical protein KFE26_19865 [Shewanella sp. M16]|uniref:hypothetical protein n=1 Tax=Shewanella sp. M16 TaxID=2830837 RepID=UPI001BAFA591|nr:hypothetical protein [Shewanella sp. M16]MBS0044538.1 hypothetical protein [Shewanella sp. M16]QYW06247.1 hypothetical protein MuM162_p06 [Shewanella phage vB_SspM_MuM16-2]